MRASWDVPVGPALWLPCPGLVPPGLLLGPLTLSRHPCQAVGAQRSGTWWDLDTSSSSHMGHTGPVGWEGRWLRLLPLASLCSQHTGLEPREASL